MTSEREQEYQFKVAPQFIVRGVGFPNCYILDAAQKLDIKSPLGGAPRLMPDFPGQ